MNRFSGGLDSSGIHALKGILKGLSERDDRTVVMATPVPELVEELASRIVVIRDGTLLAADSIDNLRLSIGCNGSLDQVLKQILDSKQA
jgi:ABC-type multidrug transport system ATPase subunit